MADPTHGVVGTGFDAQPSNLAAEVLFPQIKPTWLETAKTKLRAAYMDYEIWDQPRQLTHLLDHFLHTDARSTLVGSIPDLTGQTLLLKDKYLVQIEESVNISCPTKERCAESRSNSRMFKFCLFDGSRYIIALEHERLSVGTTAHLTRGAKLLLQGPITVHRGALLLRNCNVHFLGGQVHQMVAEYDRLKKAIEDSSAGQNSKTWNSIDEYRYHLQKQACAGGRNNSEETFPASNIQLSQTEPQLPESRTVNQSRLLESNGAPNQAPAVCNGTSMAGLSGRPFLQSAGTVRKPRPATEPALLAQPPAPVSVPTRAAEGTVPKGDSSLQNKFPVAGDPALEFPVLLPGNRSTQATPRLAAAAGDSDDTTSWASDESFARVAERRAKRRKSGDLQEQDFRNARKPSTRRPQKRTPSPEPHGKLPHDHTQDEVFINQQNQRAMTPVVEQHGTEDLMVRTRTDLIIDPVLSQIQHSSAEEEHNNKESPLAISYRSSTEDPMSSSRKKNRRISPHHRPPSPNAIGFGPGKPESSWRKGDTPPRRSSALSTHMSTIVALEVDPGTVGAVARCMSVERQQKERSLRQSLSPAFDLTAAAGVALQEVRIHDARALLTAEPPSLELLRQGGGVALEPLSPELDVAGEGSPLLGYGTDRLNSVRNRAHFQGELSPPRKALEVDLYSFLRTAHGSTGRQPYTYLHCLFDFATKACHDAFPVTATVTGHVVQLARVDKFSKLFPLDETTGRRRVCVHGVIEDGSMQLNVDFAEELLLKIISKQFNPPPSSLTADELHVLATSTSSKIMVKQAVTGAMVGPLACHMGPMKVQFSQLDNDLRVTVLELLDDEHLN